MMSGMRTVMSSIAMATFVGIGFVMWSVIAPGEERRKELLKTPGECPHDWVRTFFGGFLSHMNNTAGVSTTQVGRSIQNLPESNPVRMEETRRRNALVMQALKEAAETNDNIAREMPGPWK